MESFSRTSALLPAELRIRAEALPREDRRRCEELRLRRGHGASALIAGRERTFSDSPVTETQLRRVIEAATRSSLHAAEAQLREGFLSAGDGVRVGVCGTGVLGRDGLYGLRDFSSVALRVPRAVPGCADGIWDALTAGGFVPALIVSPPGAGKTTLLREIIRRLSDSGMRVGAADERGELSGSGRFDLGACTDVLTGIPKAVAAGMLLRSMNPQVIAMDEIADGAEAEALLRAANGGVVLLASVHAANAAEAAERPACRPLFAAGAFRRCVTVLCREGVRSYRAEELP